MKVRVEEVGYWRKCQFAWKFMRQIFSGTLPWLEEKKESQDRVYRLSASVELVVRNSVNLWNVAEWGRLILREGRVFGLDVEIPFFEKRGSLLQLLFPALLDEKEIGFVVNAVYHATGVVAVRVIQLDEGNGLEVSFDKEMIYRPELDEELEDITRRIKKAYEDRWVFDNVMGFSECSHCRFSEVCDWNWRESEIWG